MKRIYELVVFDLDGTLIATAPEISDAVNDTLLRFKLPKVTEDRAATWIGHGTRELLVQAVAFATGTDTATVRQSDSLMLIAAEFDKNYQQRSGTRSRPYPQAMEVLRTLRSAGFKLALVTNKEERHAKRLLDAHHFTEMFDQMVFGDSLNTKKPGAEGVQLCLDALGIAPERALMVGDSWIDVETARNAGISIWAMTHGYNGGEPISKSEPDRLIDSFDSLRKGLAA